MFGQSSFWFHFDTEIQFPHSLSCVQVLRFICFGSPYFIYVVLMIVAYPERKITKHQKVEPKIMHPFICISSKQLRIEPYASYSFLTNMRYSHPMLRQLLLRFIYMPERVVILGPSPEKKASRNPASLRSRH